MPRAFERSALALLVLTSLAFQPHATPQTVDQVIVHALQNQSDEGFNFYSIYPIRVGCSSTGSMFPRRRQTR